MRSWSSFRSAARLIAALVLGPMFPGAAAAQTPPPLFDAIPMARPDMPPRGAARVRVARARLDLVLAALEDSRPEAPFTLNLFDDVTLVLRRLRVEASTAGHRTWIGASAADDSDVAVLTLGASGLSGQAVVGGVGYSLQALDAGATAIRETSPAAAVLGPELPAVAAPASFDTARLTMPPADGHSTVDLLVLHTAAARVLHGGTDGIRAALAGAVAVTNTAFQRSGVAAALLATELREVPFTEAAGGIVDDLSALAPGGAQFEAVEAMRVAAGADLVALVVGRSSPAAGCGVAYLGPSPAAIYSVTEATCLGPGQWTFSHEIGHNFGADHAPGDPVVTPVDYARGFRDASVRTLMAYPAAGAPPRSLNFSSRSVREPAGTGVPTGNSLQDNARRIHETAGAVSGFAPSRFVPDAPVGISAAVSGDTVTVLWTAAPTGGPVTSYTLHAGTTPGATTFGPFETAEPRLTFTGVAPSRYFARVRSQGPGGVSAVSSEVTIDVACLVPGPAVVSAAVMGGVVALQWAAPPGVGPTRFEIGVGRTAGSLDIGRVDVGTLQAATVPAPPGEYFVRVRGLNDCGPGGVSAALRVVVP